MADYLGVGAYQGSTTYSGAEPGAAQHGQLNTSSGHTVHYGNNNLTLGGIDSESGAGLTIGGTNATSLTLGKTGVNTVVKGNLTVEGTTFTTESETVLINDNHLYLNNGYTVDTAQTGGLVVNYDPTATTDSTSGAGVFAAGVDGVSNPTVTTAGSATFSTGDLIQISGSTDAQNDGLYEVASHVGTTVSIRSTANGVTNQVEDFTQDQFVAGTDTGCTIVKVNVSVLRAGTDGAWEVGNGSATPISFTDLSAGASTMQQAYDAGPDIALDASGDITFSDNGSSVAMTLQDDIELRFGHTNTAPWSMRRDTTEGVLKIDLGTAASANDTGEGILLEGQKGGLAGGVAVGGVGGLVGMYGGAGGGPVFGWASGGGGGVELRGGAGGAGDAGGQPGGDGGGVTIAGGIGGIVTGGGSHGDGGGVVIRGGGADLGTWRGDGGALTLSGGNIVQTGSNAATGGSVSMTGGVSDTGSAGAVSISGGTTDTGTAGDVSVLGGTCTTSGSPGDAYLRGGTTSEVSGNGGDAYVRGGIPGASGTAGLVYIGDDSTSEVRVGNTTDDPTITAYNQIDIATASGGSQETAYLRLLSASSSGNLAPVQIQNDHSDQRCASTDDDGYLEILQENTGGTRIGTEVHLGEYNYSTDDYSSALVWNMVSGTTAYSVGLRFDENSQYMEWDSVIAGSFLGMKTENKTGATDAFTIKTGEVTSSGASGALSLETGPSQSGASGTVTLISGGNTAGAGASGAATVSSGSISGSATGASGTVTVTSGAVSSGTTSASGALTIASGNVSNTSGNSGNITLQTGTSSGGTRGYVYVDANYIQLNAATDYMILGSSESESGVEELQFGWGTSLPANSTGYGTGSLFIKVDDAELYINTGTEASVTWTLVGTQS